MRKLSQFRFVFLVVLGSGAVIGVFCRLAFGPDTIAEHLSGVIMMVGLIGVVFLLIGSGLTGIVRWFSVRPNLNTSMAVAAKSETFCPACGMLLGESANCSRCRRTLREMITPATTK